MDRYVVLEYLSEGGMGAIYVGKKLGAGGFEKEVVLKQLLPEYTKQEEFIELFLREAKLSATLDHANIIHTIDLVNAGNEYFIVMEYLPGGDLRTLLRKAKRRGHRFTPGAAIYIAREVLSALAYAHAKRDADGKPLRLIHRDVSPSNVLVSRAGEVKLTDFGIAKAATHTSQFYKVKGKIGYMSPEQARSQDLDHRSDLYSLAVCFYEVLTGERLFIHAGLTTSADEIYSQPVPAVSRKVPGLHAEFDKIVWKSLAIDPAERYQTAGEFQEALMRAAHRHGLLISAPELAAHLGEACGPVEGWRDEEDEVIPDAQRPGTEIYDASDDEEDDDFGAMSAVQSQHAPARRDKSVKITVPELLQGIELTSIINNISELMEEGQRAKEEHALAANALPGVVAQQAAPRPRPASAQPHARPGSAQPHARPGSAQPHTRPGSAQPDVRPGSTPLAARPRPASAQPLRADPMQEPLPSLANAGPPPLPFPAELMPPATQAPVAPVLAAAPPIMGTPVHPLPLAGPMPEPAPRVGSPPMYPEISPAHGMAPMQPAAPYPTAYPVANHPARPALMDEPGHDDRPFLRPWMVVAAILVLGAVIAAIVGLSGPDIGRPAEPPAPSPTPGAAAQ